MALIRNFQRIPQKLEMLSCRYGMSCLGLTGGENVALQRRIIQTFCLWYLRSSENRKLGTVRSLCSATPHLGPMNVCKQKFPVIQYLNSPLPLIHCRKLGWTKNGTISGLSVDEIEQMMLHINLPDQIHVGTVEAGRSCRYAQSDEVGYL